MDKIALFWLFYDTYLLYLYDTKLEFDNYKSTTYWRIPHIEIQFPWVKIIYLLMPVLDQCFSNSWSNNLLTRIIPVLHILSLFTYFINNCSLDKYVLRIVLDLKFLY